AGAAPAFRPNLAGAPAGDDRSGGSDGDRLSGSHIDSSVCAPRRRGHNDSHFLLRPFALPLINSWPRARTNSRTTLAIHVALIICRRVSWVANLYREAAACVAERSPIRREIKPAMSVRGDRTR